VGTVRTACCSPLAHLEYSSRPGWAQPVCRRAPALGKQRLTSAPGSRQDANGAPAAQRGACKSTSCGGLRSRVASLRGRCAPCSCSTASATPPFSSEAVLQLLRSLVTAHISSANGSA
jgi:hypothetical protein